MARIHSRKRGKSHSKRPVIKGPYEWIEYTPEEIEQLIVKLAREGERPAEIGVLLRDQYGIPLVKYVVGEKMMKILEKHEITYTIPPDLQDLVSKANNLARHLATHRKDKVNKRALELIEAKIHRLAKYYKRIGKLPPDWKYKPTVASIG